jgi:Bacterial regulatory helix-turn-helix protein, lysR family
MARRVSSWRKEILRADTVSKPLCSAAASAAIMDVTVIAAARRHSIPSRPPGVHSRPEMITPLSPHRPAAIRRAVEGGLHGWLRLQRFQAAMAHPTIGAAAVQLGVDQAALIRQFTRLEHDTGGPLYHRSTRQESLRPTRRGTVLLKALQRPDVAELMRHGAWAPSTRCWPGWPPPDGSPAARKTSRPATTVTATSRITGSGYPGPTMSSPRTAAKPPCMS